MVGRVSYLSVVLILFSLLYSGTAVAETLSGRVVRVVDGDTLVLLVAGE
jgi:hypothetical protein